ncbi:hypothetical protein LguiA_001498 [Lonicera macranthoides]
MVEQAKEIHESLPRRNASNELLYARLSRQDIVKKGLASKGNCKQEWPHYLTLVAPKKQYYNYTGEDNGKDKEEYYDEEYELHEDDKEVDEAYD